MQKELYQVHGTMYGVKQLKGKNMNILTAAESLNIAVAGVLSRMAGAILVTMLIAAITSPLAPYVFGSLLGYVIIFAPLAMSLFIAFKGQSMSENVIKFWFFAFASVMGLSLSMLFYAFTTASIVLALVGTTVSFGALAFYGYFTKKDLSSFGPFLFAGIIGLIVASVINIFVASTALQMTLNVLAIATAL